MQTKAEMQQLEPVLSQSIQQYEHIFDFLQKMDREIGTASSDELLELSALLSDLQGQATQTDQVLLAQLNKYSVRTETLQSLLDQRERLIKKILLLNEKITTKASGIKSLIAHEMGKLRNGISALSGYTEQQHNQGRIVNSTS
jgi:hypothetical protein